VKGTTVVTVSTARVPGSGGRRADRLLSADDAHSEGTELDLRALYRSAGP